MKLDNLHDKCCKCGKVYLCYESPMLKHELWSRVCPEEDAWWQAHDNWTSFYVCADCMEMVLGRTLEEDDLLLTASGEHVIWNTDFVRKHFPDHKYAFDHAVQADAKFIIKY